MIRKFEHVCDALHANRILRNSRGELQAQVRCPAHDDRKPSLTITEAANGRILLCCHAGCETEDILAAAGLEWPDIFDDDQALLSTPTPRLPDRPFPPPTPEDTRCTRYTYFESGKPRRVRFFVYRCEGKQFYQAVPHRDPITGKLARDGNGNLLIVRSLGGVDRILYRMPDLNAAPFDEWVCLPEGEKDADNLAALGFITTTAAGGASAPWERQYTDALRGRKVAIFADNDDIGRKRALRIAEALAGHAAEIRIVECPGVGAKGDVSDYIEAGHNASDILDLIDSALPFTASPAAVETAEDSWPLPIPLAAFDRPPLPLEVLPPRMRDMVKAVAQAHQVDPALPAFMMLGAAAIVLAKRRHVIIRDGWAEPLNLYLLAPLPSANRKSPVLKEIESPIKRWQREQEKRLRPEIERIHHLREIEEQKLAQTKKELARNHQQGDDYLRLRGDLDSIATALATDPSLAAPIVPLLLMDDHTPEKLAQAMSEQGGRMGILSAEGGPFDIIAGRHSKDGKTPNLDIYLKAHAGEDVAIHRLSRDAGSIESAALTLAIAPQPEVVQALGGKPGFAGRGLLARFLYAVPISTVGHRQIATPPVPEQYRDWWTTWLFNILELPNTDEPLRLSPPAEAKFREFEEWLEPNLDPDTGLLGQAHGWGGKLAGHVARISGLLHALEFGVVGGETIEADTVERSVSLAQRYLIPHARSAFALMEHDAKLSNAQAVLAAILRQAAPSFTVRQLFRNVTGTRSRFKRVEDLQECLSILTEYGYIRPAPTPGGELARAGRKPSPLYEVNPAVI